MEPFVKDSGELDFADTAAFLLDLMRVFGD